MPALIGTAMGTGPILFIVGYGLGTTVLDNQAVLMVLRIVSMVAILWLAWMIATATATAPVPGGTAQQEGEMRFGFLPAMLLQWVNPKFGSFPSLLSEPSWPSKGQLLSRPRS